MVFHYKICSKFQNIQNIHVAELIKNHQTFSNQDIQNQERCKMKLVNVHNKDNNKNNNNKLSLKNKESNNYINNNMRMNFL